MGGLGPCVLSSRLLLLPPSFSVHLLDDVPCRAVPCHATRSRFIAPSSTTRPNLDDLRLNSKFLLASEQRRRDNGSAYRRSTDVSSCPFPRLGRASRVSSWRFSPLIYTGGDAAASPRISPDRKDAVRSIYVDAFQWKKVTGPWSAAPGGHTSVPRLAGTRESEKR